MKTLVFILALACAPAAFSQSVLLMTGDTDTVTTTFESSRDCAGLRGVFVAPKPFDYSLSVARNRDGKFQVLLLDHRAAGNSSYVFLGTDYRKGTERACEIVKGRRTAIWRSF
jgi:hypothetical protein